jgi:hypothetical protein
MTTTTIALDPAFSPTRRRPTRRPAARPTAVRLTRRGRLVIVGLALAVLAAVGAFAGHAAASAGTRQPVRHVTVQPGETLWALAVRIAPQADPRVVVARLEAVNHLPGPDVAAGQRLVVSGVSSG